MEGDALCHRRSTAVSVGPADLLDPPASLATSLTRRLGIDARSFSPWDGRSPVSHPTCDASLLEYDVTHRMNGS